MKKGFTLIELLVVIAIIGLLSSVVFASVSSARVKAENARTLRIVAEYKNAFYLQQLDNNGRVYYDYSKPRVCLGNATNGQCTYNAGTINTDPTLNANLSKYFPSLPFNNEVVSFTDESPTSYSIGPFLRCTTSATTGQTCTLIYVLKNTRNCTPGVRWTFFSSLYSVCALDIYENY